MQRPRRTSEFQDDPGGLRRQSRVQQRNTSAPSPSGSTDVLAACTSGTAKKYNTRQSRIAIPLRPSSNERAGSTNPYLSVPSSAKQWATPQKTPLTKTSTNRVLFTVEKQRTAQKGNSVPLHNDKKWVHEQTQRITEHLLKQSTLSCGTDFLNRGLRQMSVKQFVAIINHFLGYILGNRYTVGNNYVDDIIKIMQKLQYPHPINKSWLKTPNTQHSFGNVIVLLDFFMDFVLPEEEEKADGMLFDLKNSDKLSETRMNEDIFQKPDLEFQQELLKNSEKGFLLWDKQNEEFESLILNTGNLLIKKTTGVADLKSVDLEIEKLEEILKSLKNESPPEDKEMLEMKSKLSHELESLRGDIKTLQNEDVSKKRVINNLRSRIMANSEEVDNIEMGIKSLQNVLNTQKCNVEQRDQMIADVMQNKHMLAIKERVIQDLQNRYHNEQILHSKAKKQLNTQIENFNAHMREIKFSDLMKFDGSALNVDNLELSMSPQQTDLDKLVVLLKMISKRTLHSININKEKIFQMQEHCKQLKSNIDDRLLPKLNAVRTANSNNVVNWQKLVHKITQDECKLLETIQKVEEDLATAEKTINELQYLVKNKTARVEELAQANEQTMQDAEQKHRQCLEQKKAFLKVYDEILEECLQSDELQQLIKQVQLQDKQLEELRKEFKK